MRTPGRPAALFDVRIDIALAHDLAAVRAREVHGVALGRGDEAADLLQTVGREPSLAAAALHGKAIRRLLVGTAELVAALVRVDPHLDRRRDLVEQLGVEDQEARIGGAVVIEVVVEDRGPLPAQQPLPVEPQIARGDDLGVSADMRNVLLWRGAGLGARPAGDRQRQGRGNAHPEPALPPAPLDPPQGLNALQNPSRISPWRLRPRNATCDLTPSSGRCRAVAPQPLADASMRSMSASDSPKWWPISCTSTCVTRRPSGSVPSAQ